jgi:hypothetical protein
MRAGKPRAFYRSLQGPVRVGIEAAGPIHWFEWLLAELGHDLWIGDSAKIRAGEVRKEKTDQRDALLILDLTRALKPKPALNGPQVRISEHKNPSGVIMSLENDKHRYSHQG